MQAADLVHDLMELLPLDAIVKDWQAACSNLAKASFCEAEMLDRIAALPSLTLQVQAIKVMQLTLV
jgi:hypothetical protein